MNQDSWPTEESRSSWITGSALVITRLSRVAMNIGREAATIASHTGTRRRRTGGSTGAGGPGCVECGDIGVSIRRRH